jgi:NADPH2:quinone reductase
MPLPDALTWEQAAAFPIQGLTAHHALHTAARLRTGESVLVHAAAGGVGQWCVQLAVRAGARVFGTCSTPRKIEIVRGLGAEDAFLYGPGVVASLRERTGGRGVDVVLDSVGRDTQKTSLEALAPFGRLVHYGSASGDPRPVDIDDLYDKSIQVGAFWLRTPPPPGSARAAVSALVEGLASGSLRTPEITVFPLAEAAEAHRALESRGTQGKLLLRVG